MKNLKKSLQLFIIVSAITRTFTSRNLRLMVIVQKVASVGKVSSSILSQIIAFVCQSVLVILEERAIMKGTSFKMDATLGKTNLYKSYIYLLARQSFLKLPVSCRFVLTF